MAYAPNSRNWGEVERYSFISSLLGRSVVRGFILGAVAFVFHHSEVDSRLFSSDFISPNTETAVWVNKGIVFIGNGVWWGSWVAVLYGTKCCASVKLSSTATAL
jgi:hypothetical protein